MNPPSFPPSPSSPNELAHPTYKKRGALIGIILAIVVILGGGGAAAYAAMQGWITLPYNFLAPKPPTIQEIASAIASITSGNATISIDYATQAKQANTPILPPFPEKETTSTGDTAFANALKESFSDQFSKYFMDAKMGVKSKASFDTGDQKDSQGNITLTYQNSGMSLTFDADYVYASKNIFFKLNAFPLPMLDFSTITDKWITAPTDKSVDMTGILMGGIQDEASTIWEKVESASSTDAYKADKDQKEILLFRNKLIEKQAIEIISTQRSKGPSGTPIWIFGVKLKPDQLIEALYATIDDKTDPTVEHTIFNEDLRKELDREAVQSWIKTVLASVTSELFIDAKTLMPIRQSFHARFATESSQKLQTPKEFMVDVAYELDHINQPTPVTKPEGAITLAKAIQLLSGQTDEEARFRQQTSLIGDLKQALSTYYEDHAQYPDTLQQLIGGLKYSKEYMDEMSQYTSSTEMLFPQQRVVRIPNDLFSGSPFIYAPSTDKSTYTLKYQIKLTENTKNSFFADSYVDGLNTATPATDSMEAEANKDTDGDGLTDIEEAKLGTNSYKADTDGDGYSDKQEVDSGHNPLKK